MPNYTYINTNCFCMISLMDRNLFVIFRQIFIRGNIFLAYTRELIGGASTQLVPNEAYLD